MGAEVAPGTNSLILVSGSREESGENGCNWNKGSNDDREVVFLLFVCALSAVTNNKPRDPICMGLRGSVELVESFV